MKHLGDITKLDGHNLPLVDVVTGGSPCQDLSVAGKREGLVGERSGLFMDQIRIVKEMRDESIRQLRLRGADDDIRLVKPRFMVWENVPGAFSSNKGEDFRCVLEEVCRIADKTANVPMPEKGKWSTSGCIMGDGYSVAWRVHDAQFWGVPQRRKRIALVADFGGQSAPEILFERKGLSGDIEKSREEGQGIAANTESSTDKAISFQERSGKPGGGKGILIQNDRIGALSTLNNQSVCYGLCSMNSNSMKSSNPHSGIYEADTTRTLDNNGGNPACNQGGMMVVQGADMYNQNLTGDKAITIRVKADTEHLPCVVLEGNGSRPSHQGDGYKESDVSYTLNSTEVHGVCFSQDTYDKFSQNEKSASLKACGGTYGGERVNSDTVGALCASDYKGVGNQYVNDGKCIIQSIRKSPDRQ